jgi:hypothetical protein
MSSMIKIHKLPGQWYGNEIIYVSMVNGHLVEIDELMNVHVDGISTPTDESYKAAIGISPTEKYPHPFGLPDKIFVCKTDDYAALDWLVSNAVLEIYKET